MLPDLHNRVIRMRWFLVCLVALLATPALARSDYYVGDGRDSGSYARDRHQSGYSRDDREPGFHGHAKHHRGRELSRQMLEPSRQGPAPVGFWYRCNTPAGYYPYIPTCQTPWQLVPATPLR
jgi:hypothetical protein